MIFKREIRGSGPYRQRHDVVKDAVDPEPDAKFLFVGFDVDVGRAPALSASIRIRFETLMMGADSVDLARSPRSISCPSSWRSTSTSAPSSMPVISSMLISPNPTPAMSSAVRADVCMTSSRFPPPGEKPVDEGLAFSLRTTERGVP